MPTLRNCFAIVLSCVVGCVFAADADERDVHRQFVRLAFAMQHNAFDAMADRVKAMRLTNDDKRFLFGATRKHPGNPALLATIREHQATLEEGEWTGPAPTIRSRTLNVGDVGKLSGSMQVVVVRDAASFVALATDINDDKPYLCRGWKTDNMATNSKWGLGGMVICTGIETVGSLRCLVVEPISVFKPTREEVLTGKPLAAEALAKRKK